MEKPLEGMWVKRRANPEGESLERMWANPDGESEGESEEGK